MVRINQLKIPKAWRLRKDGYKNHFVAEVQDGDTKLIVYKQWFKYRNRLDYVVKKEWLLLHELNVYKKDEEYKEWVD